MSNHGRFIWYELVTPDVAGAKAFYGKVTGWGAQDMPMEGGSYTVLDVKGAGVGGMMRLTDEMKAAGVPPNWTGYVCVDDCDASAAKAKALGGSVLREPQDIPGIGRFAIIADPAGAALAIMTPIPPEGGRPPVPVDADGAPAWHELYAADPAKGFSFYAEMFGWTKGEGHDMGPHGIYQLFNTPAGRTGGMMRKPDQMAVPAWLYYFRTGGIGAAADRVKASGGQVANGPMEVPGGDWIVQAIDPQGAMFALTETKSG